jgi:integrase
VVISSIARITRRRIGSLPKTVETVESLLQLYRRKRMSRMRKSTEATYTGYISRHLIPNFGSTKLHGLTEESIFDYASRELKKGTSLSAVRGRLLCLQGAYNWYWDLRDLSSRNPSRFIKRALRDARDRVGDCSRQGRRPFSKEEGALLLDCAQRSGAYDLVAVAFGTGLRRGEIFGMEWDGIDWFRGEYMPRVQRGPHGIQRLKAERKASDRARLSPKVLEVLRLRLQSRDDSKEGASRWVFPDPPWKLARLLEQSLRLARREGLDPSLTLHCARHRWASAALEAGYSLEEVRAQGGWGSAAFVASRYLHTVREKELADFADV